MAWVEHVGFGRVVTDFRADPPYLAYFVYVLLGVSELPRADQEEEAQLAVPGAILTVVVSISIPRSVAEKVRGGDQRQMISRFTVLAKNRPCSGEEGVSGYAQAQCSPQHRSREAHRLAGERERDSLLDRM